MKMTDQKNPQQSNPNIADDHIDIFGGSDDVFENSEILEPIKDTLEGIEQDLDQTQREEVLDDLHSSISTESNFTTDNVASEPAFTEDGVYDVDSDWNAEPQVEPQQSVDSFIEDVSENESVDSSEDVFGGDILEEVDIDDSSAIDALDEIDDLDILDLPENEDIEPIETISTEELVTEDIFEEEEEERMPENEERMPENDSENIGEYEEYIEDEEEEEAEEIEEEEEAEEEEEIEEEEEEEEIEEEEEDEEIEEEAYQRETNVEIEDDKTDLQRKFYELIAQTRSIYDLVEKEYHVGFDILGANDDRQKTMYKLYVGPKGEDFINIEKTETIKSDDSQEVYLLRLYIEDSSLQVAIDDDLLYDEKEDLQEDPNKISQVSEKLNKFIFLVTDEYKKIEKQKKEKDKKNTLKGIFRNF